jgi:hypothetical protein
MAKSSCDCGLELLSSSSSLCDLMPMAFANRLLIFLSLLSFGDNEDSVETGLELFDGEADADAD